MNALNDVKGYMEFWGWSDGGGPGSVKRDDGGRMIAKHGDAQWQTDVEMACATLMRLQDRILSAGQAP